MWVGSSPPLPAREVFTLLREPQNLWDKQRLFADYLDAFKRVKTLLDVGVVNVSLIDPVLGNQFFILVNHPKVQEYILYSAPIGRFSEIFALHQQLTLYRQRKRVGIPQLETDLQRQNPELYESNLQAYLESV